jgi:signal transduction histidine kinase
VAWTRRLTPRDAHLVALDLVAGAALLIALASPLPTSAPLSPGAEPYSPPGWVAGATWAVAVGVAVPVALRRFWPMPALGVILVASAAGLVILDLRWPATIAATAATALALYSVASTTGGPAAVVALSAGIFVTGGVGLFGAAAVTGPGPPGPAVPSPDAVGQAILSGLLLCAAWAVGRATRRQRSYAADAAEQAAQHALIDERHRIARELHDIVAHSMSLIAVKAGIANHVAEARPQEAREALHLIETTSRAALVELRRVLDVLRAGTDEPAELDPTPGLAGLPALARHAASAGVAVQVASRDPSAPPDEAVPPGVQLSVYRIVQEALTNVVKHAGRVPCRVAVTVGLDAVRVEVIDEGPAVPPAADGRAGHGLIGMRERVAAYGGSFGAGPRPGGGFAVRATLPYEPVSS